MARASSRSRPISAAWRTARSSSNSRESGWGAMDILVANAGIWNEKDTPIEDVSEREWNEMVKSEFEQRLFRHSFRRAAHEGAEVRAHHRASARRRASAAKRFTPTTARRRARSSAL